MEPQNDSILSEQAVTSHRRSTTSDSSPIEVDQTHNKRSFQNEGQNKRMKSFQTESSGEDSGFPGSGSNAEGEGPVRPTYHFKKDIKWRFASDKRQDEILANQTDERVEVKDVKPPTSTNGSSDYMSDISGSNGRSSSMFGGNADANSGYSSGSNSNDSSLNNTVPAFALHPAGVFYVPLVLPVSQVLPFVKHHRSMGVCHPISIPVSFTGPFHIGVPHAHDSPRTPTSNKSSHSKHGGSHSSTNQKKALAECPPLISMKWQER